MSARHASCSCGGLKLEATGEPVRISMCHCIACQQRTGSAFGIQARFPRDAVTLHGRATQFARTGDSGGTITQHFCATCGSTVFWEIDALPGFIAIAVGSFGDPTFPPPTVAVYEARRHPWAIMPELDVEHLD
ncbi:MAG: GFA family protein [Labilithrix sp.]|nr:GFA family protein [Labilithrix sp.]